MNSILVIKFEFSDVWDKIQKIILQSIDNVFHQKKNQLAFCWGLEVYQLAFSSQNYWFNWFTKKKFDIENDFITVTLFYKT